MMENNSRHPELDSGSSRSIKGFTLIELLVVVIIIAVLTAVAMPMYKRAVLKSRFSTLMPVANSLAKGNEVYYLANGEYTDQEANLDIEGQASAPEGTTITLETDPEYLSYVRVANNDKIPNARYVVYQQHSKNFAGTTMCEAKDDTAKELCQSLGGVFVSENGTEGRWTSYLLSGQLAAGNAFREPCPEGAICNENDEVTGCNSGYYLYEGSCRVSHEGDYDYAGTRSCSADFINQFCYAKTFGDNASCKGNNSSMSNRNAYCYGSTFSGEASCTNRANCNSVPSSYGVTRFTDNASCTNNGRCYGAVFSGNASCTNAFCNFATNSGVTTFTDNASCTGNAYCYGAVFSGNSTCTSILDSGGCSSSSYISTFTDNAVCGGTGCDTANYEGNACCSSCSVGSGKPKCGGGTW